jgi:AcrR family transcriptional regulator
MKPRLTREKQKEETREKIINAAIDIFVEQGYPNAQMKQVYERVGIGKKTLYRYFSSKIDLALAVETKIIKSMVEQFMPVGNMPGVDALTAYEKIEKLYKEVFLKFIHNNEKLFKFTAHFDVNVTGLHEELESGREFTKYIQGLDDFTIGLLREGQLDGSIRKDIDIKKTIIAGNNSLMGLILRVFAREENLLVEQGVGREMIEWYMDMYLDYIKAR